MTVATYKTETFYVSFSSLQYSTPLCVFPQGFN